MDSPLYAYILIGASALGLGPVMIVMGLRAYTGRWTSWLALTAQSTAKHSRLGFVLFWGGLGVTGCFLLIGLQEMGVRIPGSEAVFTTFWCVCIAIAMMHQFFLPKFLRPVLLPQWYRDWEAEQFEREARQDKQRRAQRRFRREKRRLAKEQGARSPLNETDPVGTPSITIEVEEKVIWSKTWRS
ncbi:hypothetical protein [Arthrobacter sp. zg-Y1143]|uniref:hypothetical protein n=1 Tax=Arthrobacter sp. zg-Y1143 TaxID=3049065 RepID=UPI0024C361DD|nr:hypothetical protein [Arthrobacter sp. zg-Y1143]MDK1326625.1 hypothetical protein [Arthrobacter sp. zg-Y1143]